MDSADQRAHADSCGRLGAGGVVHVSLGGGRLSSVPENGVQPGATPSPDLCGVGATAGVPGVDRGAAAAVARRGAPGTGTAGKRRPAPRSGAGGGASGGSPAGGPD